MASCRCKDLLAVLVNSIIELFVLKKWFRVRWNNQNLAILGAANGLSVGLAYAIQQPTRLLQPRSDESTARLELAADDAPPCATRNPRRSRACGRATYRPRAGLG
ncbi:MAG TPA: hypothetical protein VF331_24440 [Polyangiales bacterium]